MGLFDGASGRGELASTAHVAKLLDAPVLLVVDAASMARSAAAIVHGYRTFDPDVRVAGVIFNRVGSDHHEQLLREALADLGVPVLGALRRDERVATPERHLGLVPADEREARRAHALATLERGGGALRRPRRRRAPGALGAGARRAGLAPGAGRRARRAARASRSRAARRSRSTTRRTSSCSRPRAPSCRPSTRCSDEALPEGAGALILAGGFPEVFGGELAANDSLRAEIAAFARSGKPVLAECGGPALPRRRARRAGRCAASLPVRATMTRRLTLGYREATAVSADAVARRRGAGARARVPLRPGRAARRRRAGARGSSRRAAPSATRASSPAASRPASCTCTGRPSRRSRAASWAQRGARVAGGMSAPPLVVVGIGADGWAGLGEAARAAVLAAEVIVGSQRQLALLPTSAAERRPWPSPIDTARRRAVQRRIRTRDLRARERRPDAARHRRHARAAPRARAALRGASASLRARARVRAAGLARGRRRARERRRAARRRCSRARCSPAGASWPTSPARMGASELARVLRERGFGPSRMVVLEQLGGDGERVVESTAAEWGERCRSARSTASRSSAAPDPEPRLAAAHRRDCPTTPTSTTARSPSGPIRAVTLAALAPAPGQLLWDVGAGSGSIGIEWLRAEPTARAIAIEAARRPRGSARLAMRSRSACRSSTSGTGEAPAALAGLWTARRDLHRRRAHGARPARSLLGGPAARRPPRRERRHARERARAGRPRARSTAESSRAST